MQSKKNLGKNYNFPVHTAENKADNQTNFKKKKSPIAAFRKPKKAKKEKGKTNN